MKELPNEGSLLNVGVADINYCDLDPNLFDWVVEKPNIKKNRPIPKPRITPTTYRPKVITKHLNDLTGTRREEYLAERGADLSIPKNRYGAKVAKSWARDDNDDLIMCEVSRVDLELKQLRQQMKVSETNKRTNEQTNKRSN